MPAVRDAVVPGPSQGHHAEDPGQEKSIVCFNEAQRGREGGAGYKMWAMVLWASYPSPSPLHKR